MIIDLTAEERAEMKTRSSDVTELVRILKDMGVEDVSRESAFKAWSEHSESVAANWLVITKDPAGFREVERSHESLVDRWENARADYVLGRMAARTPAPAPPPRVAVPERVPPSDRRSHKAVFDLKEIGFDPPSNATRGEDRLTRMGHVAGRLRNVEYMANAIDAADCIPKADRAPAVDGGQRQFDSMIHGDRKDLAEAGRCYVALRRAQRDGDDLKVRTGLVLLVAADHDEIGYRDVLAAMGDDGMPREQRIEAERGPLRLTGAKGPAAASGVATMPMTKGSVER